MICPNCKERIVAEGSHDCEVSRPRGGLGRSALPPAYGAATRDALVNHYLSCSPLPPIWVRPGKPIVIGRSTTCDLRLAGTMISRQHARIELRGDSLFVRDLASRNGTRINDSVVEEAELESGDVMTIGGWAFTYRTAIGNAMFTVGDDEAERVSAVDTARIGAASLKQALKIRELKRELEEKEMESAEPTRRQTDESDRDETAACSETDQGLGHKHMPAKRPAAEEEPVNGQDSDIAAIVMGRAD